MAPIDARCCALRARPREEDPSAASPPPILRRQLPPGLARHRARRTGTLALPPPCMPHRVCERPLIRRQKRRRHLLDSAAAGVQAARQSVSQCHQPLNHAVSGWPPGPSWGRTSSLTCTANELLSAVDNISGLPTKCTACF